MSSYNRSHSRYVYQKYVKRIIDILLSLTLLIILFIPGLVIAFIICTTSRGPAFFTQKRTGYMGQPFTIYKFRSMRIEAPHNIATADLENSQRYTTKFGRILRKTSIDELPQLINVLKGDMSLIGPRPLIPTEKIINATRHQLGIDTILPGITGLAQINGRDMISDKAKVQFDLKYYQNISFSLDMRICGQTIMQVLKHKDIKK